MCQHSITDKEKEEANAQTKNKMKRKKQMVVTPWLDGMLPVKKQWINYMYFVEIICVGQQFISPSMKMLAKNISPPIEVLKPLIQSLKKMK